MSDKKEVRKKRRHHVVVHKSVIYLFYRFLHYIKKTHSVWRGMERLAGLVPEIRSCHNLSETRHTVTCTRLFWPDL